MKKLFTVLFLTVCINIITAQTNLIVNSGFENYTDTVFTGWWLNDWGGAVATITNTTGTNVISGNVSALVNVIIPSADKIEKVSLMTEAITNAPKEGDLLLTVYGRTDSLVNLPFKLSLKCVTANGDKKWFGGNEVLLNTTPQKISFVSSPPAEYRDFIFVRLSCGKSSGKYIFDDVYFAPVNDTASIIPSGRRLREIVADKYPNGNVYIGGTTQYGYWGTTSEDILNREFSYITPANSFKQSYVHPEPGVYRWERCDTWVQKAKDNNQVIRIHSPISPQCSKWAKDDSRTGEELLQNLEEYVTALCQHYNNEKKILWMDVVNETIDKTTGEWFGPKPGTDKWENPWTIIGFDTTYSETFQPPLYIKRAFELANQYAPNIKQIINQHGTMNDAAWDKVKLLVKYLRDKGLRVDGIGFQCHVDVGWEKGVNDSGINNIVALGNLIDWAHANGLEFHITENNVYLRNGNERKWEEQAETFKAIVKTVISKRNTGVVIWNTWMLRDGNGQAGARNPCLFNQDGSAKPAYYAVQSSLEDTVTTGVLSHKTIDNSIVLYNNYPNPFNPTTTIRYSIQTPLNPPFAKGGNTGGFAYVQLKVYDILGKEVATLVNKEQKPGLYKVEFNGSSLSSGIYFSILKIGKKMKIKKMTLVK